MCPIENFFNTICSQLLPSACIVCETFQQHILCTHCASLLHAEHLSNYECCQQCGLTLLASEIAEQRCQACASASPYFDETHCLDRYEGRLQPALHQLKYQGRLACANGLASAWNQLMPESLKKLQAGYLLPVPLSQEKLCARGFNQAWELARRIYCTSPINKNPHVLLRHHHIQHQAHGNRESRYKAIREMFYINPLYCKSLEGQTVIVFDDVMTSGATLNEIARILKHNGVSKVINWVLLRALRPTQQRAQHV